MNSSWKTTLIGWIVIIGDVVKLIADTVSDKGFPTSFSEWVTFLMVLGSGIGLLFAKDYDKSNSPTPAATANPVP